MVGSPVPDPRQRHTRRKPGPQSHGSSPPPRRSTVTPSDGRDDELVAAARMFTTSTGTPLNSPMLTRAQYVVLLLATACVAGSEPNTTPDLTAVPRSSQPPGEVWANEVNLVGAGDIAWCSNNGDEATAKLLDTLPGTVFTAGDNAYEEGTASQFANCYGPTWGRHKVRTRPSPGNHDYATTGASAYYAYFGSRAGPAGRGYYSYDVGSWHVISLNSNVSMANGSAQHTWLKNDLAASSSLCTLAYWHHPWFASGTQVGGSTASKPLWNLLFAAGADVIVAGHEHNYERFAPQTPAGRSQCHLRHTGVRGRHRWEESLQRGALTTAAQQPGLQWDDVGSVGPAAGGGWLSLEVRARGRQDLHRCWQHSVPRKARLLSTEAQRSTRAGRGEAHKFPSHGGDGLPGPIARGAGCGP